MGLKFRYMVTSEFESPYREGNTKSTHSLSKESHWQVMKPLGAKARLIRGKKAAASGKKDPGLSPPDSYIVQSTLTELDSEDPCKLVSENHCARHSRVFFI